MLGRPASIQYWHSYDHLIAYSRSTDSTHLPAWRDFNSAARRTDAVGMWHETYRVSSGQWEAVYSSTKDIGLLGAVGGRALDRGSSSSTRIGDLSIDSAPVDAPPAG